jgi:hypothetical protein
LLASVFASTPRGINRNPGLESCMKKAVLAGVFAPAMVGTLFVSDRGIGVTQAAAQEVVLTEGHIARLRGALRLTSEQMRHWAPVEAALRAAIRNGSRGDQANYDGSNEGFVQKVRTRVRGYVVQASALQQVASAAGPLIASLDENQKRAGANVIRSLGVAF